MIQLQSNFTTPEQSRRLLELGVPIDSADMFYNRYMSLSAISEHSTFNKFCDIKVDIPCWSVGRLVEIYELCTGHKFSRTVNEKGKFVFPSLLIEILHKIGHAIINSVDGLRWDFSKLED